MTLDIKPVTCTSGSSTKITTSVIQTFSDHRYQITQDFSEFNCDTGLSGEGRTWCRNDGSDMKIF